MRNLTFVVTLLASSVAAAQEKAPAKSTPPSAPPEATAAPSATAMKAIVRGFYIETQVGGGYTVAQAKVDQATSFNPQIAGKDEGLGPGSTVLMAMGYDIADSFALEIVGGATMISSVRSNYVRDMMLTFVGVGARLAFALSDRTNFLVTGAGIYAKADNGFPPSQISTGGLFGLGLEYYVHVRHFSIGLEVTTIAPVTPLRVFVALSPTLKYTF
jgi:hypothetical protein